MRLFKRYARRVNGKNKREKNEILVPFNESEWYAWSLDRDDRRRSRAEFLVSSSFSLSRSPHPGQSPLTPSTFRTRVVSPFCKSFRSKSGQCEIEKPENRFSRFSFFNYRWILATNWIFLISQFFYLKFQYQYFNVTNSQFFQQTRHHKSDAVLNHSCYNPAF